MKNKDMTWLLKPENKHILESVLKGLNQTEYVEIDLDMLEKNTK